MQFDGGLGPAQGLASLSPASGMWKPPSEPPRPPSPLLVLAGPPPFALPAVPLPPSPFVWLVPPPAEHEAAHAPSTTRTTAP